MPWAREAGAAGSGSGGGGIQAAGILRQSGDASKGLEIALRTAGAGADWGLRGVQRQINPVLRAADARRLPGDLDYLTITLPASLATPGGGEDWTLRVERFASGGATTAVLIGRQIRLTLAAGQSRTLTQIRTLLAQIDGLAAGDITIHGTPGNAFLWSTGFRVIPFSAGSAAEPNPLGVVDEAAKTYTVKYDAAQDTLQEIADALNDEDDAEVTLIYGSNGGGAPEAVGFTRAFEGRRGAAGQRGSSGGAASLRTLQVAKATAAGVGNDVAFQSSTDDYLIVVEPDVAAPRIKITLPAGKSLVGIYDSGVNITNDFTQNGQVWLSDIDYDGGAIMLLVRTD